MKQSDRMRLYLEYYNHPLKKEYLKEKSKIKSRRLPTNSKIVIAICTIPFILIFVIGYLFFKDVNFIYGLGSIGHTLLYIAVGIGNLVLCFYAACLSIEYGFSKSEETDEFEKLRKKYEEKGLWEVDDPFTEKCSEFDDYMDCFVCSATREPLSNQEIRWCETPGNCRKCARFLTAMGFDVKNREDIEKW